MQNQTQTTNATEQTNEKHPTLAAMIATHHEREQQEATKRREEAAEHRHEKMQDFEQDLRAYLPAPLYDELQPLIRWNGRTDIWYNGYPEAVFILDGEEWGINNRSGWRVYCQHPGHFSDEVHGSMLADTLIAKIVQHGELSPLQQTPDESAEDEQLDHPPSTPRPALYCVGTSDRAFLRDGREVIVSLAMAGEMRGTVADADDHWMLLTESDGEQTLINRHHILTVALIESTSTLPPRISVASPAPDDDGIPF